MPHIILEHTEAVEEAIDIRVLNKKLHKCLSDQESVSLESIKTRSICVQNAITGDGTKNDFIHISILLLAGRSDELKKTMAEAIFLTAEKFIGDFDLKLSVNIDELGTYRK